ncbi:hypothetical protein HUO13_19835 [Saccharopolyspora erythraea]|uniref:hypothetical protein n=1 Tax=Saccharopolyspora erythraea TaxID=1836 RepID=UPI001BAE2EAF|nr:hypothetical protein [Saccharopolyspora erythraea]QUH02756.1 hypothetical protein HUO13_19835 [Saccharopolyspora erythraea]
MREPDIEAAEKFIGAQARVLDRRRFERLFRDGPAGAVRDAVAAYRNSDCGFGHALEPDGRCPHTQPAAIAMALRTLDEADAWDAELVAGACGWLERNAPGEGGATFVDPGIEGWPHAPWWMPEPGLPASPVSTGQIAGVLHSRATTHPWLDRATDLMWSRVENAGPQVNAYEMFGMLAFLQHVPDVERAHKAFRSVGALLLEGGLVDLDPDAAGEVHGPLDYAPRPDSLARELFDDAVVAAHLDRLAAAQQDDGGWNFDFLSWSPVAQAEWRGSVTVDSLRLLRVNGRL